jgi:hypothetical protein
MSDNQIVNQVNADEQEPVKAETADTTTATTAAPAENGTRLNKRPMMILTEH